MIELFEATFSAVNIIPAAFLTFVVFYWLLVIFGALDISSVDIDIDLDADVEVEADLEAETSEFSVSWFNNVLAFFNIDKLPLMVFLTFWAIPTWAISILLNDMLGNESVIISLLLLIPTLIVSLFIAKPLTIPFVKIFAKLNDTSEGLQDLIGRTGQVVTGASDLKMGQADINIDGSNYRVNIKTKKGSLKRGQQILLINLIQNGKCYIAEPYETID